MLEVKKLLAKVLASLVITHHSYSLSYGTLYVERFFDTMIITLIGSVLNFPSGAWTTIATLSANERPSQNVYFSVCDNNTAQAAKVSMMGRIVSATGAIQLYKYADNATTNQPMFTVTYVVGGVVRRLLALIPERGCMA